MKGTKSADYKKKLKSAGSSKRSFKAGTALELLKGKMPKGAKVPKDHLKTTALTTKSDAMYMPDAEMDISKDYKENMSRIAKDITDTDTNVVLEGAKAKLRGLKKKYSEEKNGK